MPRSNGQEWVTRRRLEVGAGREVATSVQHLKRHNAPVAVEINHDTRSYRLRLDDLRIRKANVECIGVWIIHSLQGFTLRSKKAVIIRTT
jgi:hypothetical protein